MKTFRFIVPIFSTILILFFSCKGEDSYPQGEIAYYKFRGEDLERLLPYSQGDTLIFRDETGTDRKFYVEFVTRDSKRQLIEGGGMTFFYSTPRYYYYYDEKHIILKSWQRVAEIYEPDIAINFLRSPIDNGLAKSNIYKEFPSAFTAYIEVILFCWNEIDYDANKTEMSVNGINYTNVLIFDCTDSHTDINILYYDEKQGVIGFDDVYNHQWRLAND
jgi:hypothetical protein